LARVFISYRRSDSRWAAGRLYDRLSEALGRENVFFDVSSIEPGEDFVDRIEQMVGECDVLLAIIGPQWLSVQDKSGKRRLDNVNDLIRVEIGAALKRKIRVVPLLVDDAEMPDPQHLPDELATLARRNAHELSFGRFHEDLESFVHVLERILAGPAAQAGTEKRTASPPGAKEAQAPLATELPFTIALETLGGVASPLLPKGTQLPAEATEIFTTAQDNQTSVEVKLFVGERATTVNDVLLGKVTLSGIPPSVRGAPQIAVKAAVDTTLILTVTAEDQATRRKEVLDAFDLKRVELPASARKRDPDPAPPAGSAAQAGADSRRQSESPADFDEAFSKLSEFFGGKKGKPPGRDLQYELELTLVEAVLGTDPKIIETELGRKVTVRIPRGVDDAMRLRLAGEGAPGEHGGKPGDLYIFLRIPQHPYFSRQDKDLYCRARISAIDARRGTIIKLPPLGTGSGIQVRVPAGAKNGSLLRVNGQGVPDLKDGNPPGDLFVRIEVSDA
jgi:hypothetical protein